MITTHASRFSFAALLAVSAACSSSSSPANSGGGAGADAGAAGAVVTGEVDDIELSATGDAQPIVNASVCIEGHSEVPCVATGADGTYSLTIPFLPLAAGASELNLAINATAQGYLGATNLVTEDPPVAGLGAGTLWPSGIVLRSDDEASTWATAAGFTYPSTTTGFVSIRVSGANAGTMLNATATISPSSGTIVYGDAEGVPSPTLAGTTTSGAIYFGNVTPGDVTITVTAPGLTCTSSPGGLLFESDWPSTGDNVAAVAIAGSETTGIFVICE